MRKWQEHILFLTFDFAPFSEAITIRSLIELRVGKPLLCLFLIVYWCQSNFQWGSSIGSFPFWMARWFDKTQSFFYTRETPENKAFLSMNESNQARMTNRNIIHTEILPCDSKFHHQGIVSSPVIDWANDWIMLTVHQNPIKWRKTYFYQFFKETENENSKESVSLEFDGKVYRWYPHLLH